MRTTDRPESPPWIVERGSRHERVLLDRPDSDALRALLSDPERAFEAADWLKCDTTSSVVRAALADRSVVLKRYEPGSLLRAARNRLRPSRASRSFRAGHALRAAGVRSPEPLGYVDVRLGPLRRRSYLVTEFVSGRDGRATLGALEPGWRDGAGQLVDMLNALWSRGFRHGDLKATNILMTAEGPCLVDLDHAGRVSAWRHARAVARDQARLLANWPERPALLAFLRERFVDPAACLPRDRGAAVG